MSNKTRSLFPNLNATVAFYDHGNFFITLNSISEAHLAAIRADPNTEANIEHLKTIQHETRHFSDHFCTLWGQKNLLKYIRAINARVENRTENFPDIIDYCIECNQLFYANYYTEQYGYVPVDSIARRWKWHSTTGLRFNAKGQSDPHAPLPMIHFTAYDDTPLLRIPLSIASLLETNAKWEEIQLQLGFIAAMDEKERPFHFKEFERDTLFRLLYDQNYALYNVAVHLAANCLGLRDIIMAFRIASSIATLTLNLPYDLVQKIPIHKKFEKWGERSRFMLENNEYGFIYYLLLSNYRAFFEKKQAFVLQDVLECSGLPDYASVKQKVDGELSVIQQQIQEMPNLAEFFYGNALVGRKICNEAGLGFEKKPLFQLLLDNHFVPKMLCSDTLLDDISHTPAEIFAMRPIKTMSDGEWFDFAADIYDRLTELFEVRGI